MPVIDVSIIRDGDPPPFPDIQDPIHLPDQPWRLAVIERGMSSGAPSLVIVIDLPDGKTVIAETSVAVWIAATAGMRGAFPEAFAGGPFAER